jgi:hypothetical protein
VARLAVKVVQSLSTGIIEGLASNLCRALLRRHRILFSL